MPNDRLRTSLSLYQADRDALAALVAALIEHGVGRSGPLAIRAAVAACQNRDLAAAPNVPDAEHSKPTGFRYTKTDLDRFNALSRRHDIPGYSLSIVARRAIHTVSPNDPAFINAARELLKTDGRRRL